MKAKRDDRGAAALTAAGRDPDRGALFWWLYDNHNALKRRGPGRPIKWRHVLADLPDADRLDGAGTPATPRVAAKTWIKVQRFVAAEMAERQAKQRPARVPTPRANVSPPMPVPPPVHPRPPVSWVVPPASPAPSHSRPTAGEPTTAPMTEGQRVSIELLEEFKRRP